MPLGYASFINGAGSIKADDLPSPVEFVRAKYPDVTEDMRVYFERRPDNPVMASTVRPASAGDQLASLAAPSVGLTPRARGLIADTANNLSAAIAHTPGEPIAGNAAFDVSIAEMTVIAAKLKAHRKHIGIAIVRAAILKQR